MSGLLLQPTMGPIDAVVAVPGSKSLTNRALICAALADGDTRLTGALLADDTRHMIDALRALGVAVESDQASSTLTVSGCGGHLPASGASLYCGNSGTTMRFCTALVCLGSGLYRLEGVARMYQRPIAALVDALCQLGARFEYPGADGYPPLVAHATGLAGGETSFDSPPSSQVVSALLMAAPYARSDVFVKLAGALVSAPYVAMTVRVMQDFGVTVLAHADDAGARYMVEAPQRYRGKTYAIEPDASNASYFLAAPAIVGGTVTVNHLGTDSPQGDVHFVDLLEQMGCRVDRGKTYLTVHGPPPGRRLNGIDVDLNAMPDMAQTLAVVALFAHGATRIRHVANLRIKETDRLTALTAELGRLGAQVELHEDGLTIHPPGKITPAPIKTYDDHRMAMSFALAGLAVDGVVIDDPGCVAKTFPDFFERWQALSTGLSNTD